MDVEYIHLPILKQLIGKFLSALMLTVNKEETQEKVDELTNRLLMQSVEEIKERAVQTKRDLLYINAY